jgi:hypothetical protein
MRPNHGRLIWLLDEAAASLLPPSVAGPEARRA